MQGLQRINKDVLRLLKQMMKYPDDKAMQKQLALTGIKQLEQQLNKLKIKKKAVQIESLVNKNYVFAGCSLDIFLSFPHCVSS